MPDPSAMGLIVVPDPRYLDMTNMPDFTNNKQIGQLYTLVSRREKRKKKHK
jgi:penicillin V acylase-like amidase (Ntn superfamily)